MVADIYCRRCSHALPRCLCHQEKSGQAEHIVAEQPRVPKNEGLAADSSAERKERPLWSGCMNYFPNALLEVARLSLLANEKHNPGQPLHWSKEKSNDHADCASRHLLQKGEWDYGLSKPVRHSAAAAWRALANLEMEILEARKNEGAA